MVYLSLCAKQWNIKHKTESAKFMRNELSFFCLQEMIWKTIHFTPEFCVRVLLGKRNVHDLHENSVNEEEIHAELNIRIGT